MVARRTRLPFLRRANVGSPTPGTRRTQPRSGVALRRDCTAPVTRTPSAFRLRATLTPDVRRFLCGVHAKTQSGAPMEAIETLASLWIAEHPEYHADLSNADAAVARNYDATPGQTNPFLHLSMHLSISEQCSIDQPRGIRQAVELLTARLDSLHDAHHAAMDCLGEMLWESQRSGRPPDGNAYIAAVQRRATRD